MKPGSESASPAPALSRVWKLAEACASRTHRRHQRCRPPVLKTEPITGPDTLPWESSPERAGRPQLFAASSRVSCSHPFRADISVLQPRDWACHLALETSMERLGRDPEFVTLPPRSCAHASSVEEVLVPCRWRAHFQHAPCTGRVKVESPRPACGGCFFCRLLQGSR